MPGSQLEGFLIEPGSSRVFHPLSCKKLDDGRYVLMVDTEMELTPDNIYISNIKVGSVDQTKTNVRYLKVLDNGVVIAVSNPSQFYKIADVDDNGLGNISYYGFVDVDGGFYILKEDLSVSPNTYRYAVGSSNYSSNWTNRASLTYSYFYEVF